MIRRFLQRMDESERAGRMIEWLLVCLAIVALLVVIAIASRGVDGDLDTSAKVSEEQHLKVRDTESLPPLGVPRP